jgi:pimeloyl-ACP methyl ester carboxylesterase
VAVPTTYVWGEEDLALGKTAALATEQFVTASYRFVSLPGISHWVPDQAPEVVAAEIIARVTSAR